MGLGSFAGMALLIGLLAASDADDVGQALLDVGWGLAGVVAIRGVAVTVAGWSWACLFAAEDGVATPVLLGLRWIREGVNTLLPVAAVGGDVLGGRLLTFFGVPAGVAGASIVVDLMAQVGTQFLFTLVGLGVLVAIGGDPRVVHVAAVGAVMAAPVLVAFFCAQRYGLFRLLERDWLGLGQRWRWLPIGKLARLHDSIQALYGCRRRVARCTLLHFLVWFVGVGEIWLALRCMGRPVSLGQALVLESLGQAVRGAGFAVPGALGIQEGGFLVLGHMFGIPAEPALALSLVKRVPDLAWGLPALLGWQVLESRRLLRRQVAAADA